VCNAENHHPSCTCGFGGVGHRGKSPGGWHNTENYARPTSYHSVGSNGYRWNNYDDDWCISIICCRCGASIFLVHYNGGYASFDVLGKPWSKHPCYDSSYSSKYGQNNTEVLHQQITYQSQWLTTPVIGVIIECHQEVESRDTQVLVRCAEEGTVKIYIPQHPVLRRIIGDIILLSKPDRKIVFISTASSCLFQFEVSLPFVVGERYEHEVHGWGELISIIRVGDKFGIEMKLDEGSSRKMLISATDLKLPKARYANRYW